MSPQGDGWDLPQGVKAWSNFHWFKVSPRKPLDVVVLSERPTWYVGHFVDGRMMPCQAPRCAMCEDGVGQQVRYVLGVVEVDTRRTGLLEVSESLGLLIRDWVPRSEGLRGMHLVFTKHSPSVKSRSEVELRDTYEQAWHRSLECPDPEVALELTWKKMKIPAPEKMFSRR